MPKLLIKTGDKKGTVHQLTDKAVSIGRDASNNIVLPDRRISRMHACITPMGKDYVIEDLKSVNGVYVNNGLVTKQVLKSGDEIKMGATFISFLPLDAPEDIKGETDVLQVKMLADHEVPDGMTVEMTVIPDKVAPVEEKLAAADPGTMQKAYERLMTLYRISHDLGAVLDLPELLDRILAIVLEIMKGDRGFIMLIDKETGEFALPVVRRKKGMEKDEIAISKTILEQVRRTGEAVLTSDALQDSRFKEADSIIFHGIRSTMCVPIKSKDQICGVMHVDTKAREISFSKQDLELLTAISQQAAAAIENTRLFDDLKRANQELKNQQDRLIEAEKLSAMGRLAGGVAHEINNPMTSILGYSDLAAKLLEKETLAPQQVKECAEYLKVIQEESQQCKRIAQTLLQFGRQKKAEMAPVRIHAVIEAALAVARFHLKKAPIEIKKELAEDLPAVTADSGQLQQVFLNLIVNARDAMEKGGTLTITTRRVDDKWIEARFQDTGCGIPAEQLNEIFKPLFTTKEEGKGTGLGLSVSQEIIDRHHGTMDVESVVGKGTAFIIRLPA